jgi:hypothetical protein
MIYLQMTAIDNKHFRIHYESMRFGKAAWSWCHQEGWGDAVKPA